MGRNDPLTRRGLLKATATAVAASGGIAGGAAADPNCEYTYVYTANSPTVYESCGGNPIGVVDEALAEGCAENNCLVDGEEWVYVEWFNASPDGWVPASEVNF